MQNTKNSIFALDIGTRSVVGLVGTYDDGIFTLQHLHSIEHKRRAMVDGQIEDIGAVAQVVVAVKEELQSKLGFELSDVYVAAAGRALVTCNGTAVTDLGEDTIVTQQMISELQMLCIQNAFDELQEQKRNVGMTCVGHSVKKYTLDNHTFSSLLNHKGRMISAEVIATFLPEQVVDSLYSAMNLAGLSVAGMTLEPIAAMNAIVPEELRRLNLALVDIGAGTSDIAVSAGGAISAYTMATIAGDEISDSLATHYLVDFNMAEQMKQSAGTCEEIAYTDILGNEATASKKELMDVMGSAIKELARTICDDIKDVNGKAPQAVFLVGGGSKTPTLADIVAQGLSLDRSRVAVGGNNYMKRMVEADIDVSDPEYATPFGIAITAANGLLEEGSFVIVNGKKLRLYKSEGLSVMDALLLFGFRHNQLLGKPGKPLRFNLNGTDKIITGKHAIAATITLNGKAAGISTPINTKDVIEVKPAKDGKDARVSVGDVVPKAKSAKKVFINDIAFTVGTVVKVNDKSAVASTRIPEGAKVKSSAVNSLKHLCAREGFDMQFFCFTQDGETAIAPNYKFKGEEQLTMIPYNEVSIAPPTPKQKKVAVAKVEVEPPAETEPAPPPPQEPEEPQFKVFINEKSVSLPMRHDGRPYLFVDMLNHINYDPSKAKGNVLIQKNGISASYLDVVKQGDKIHVSYEED